jgi:hypothetical protein
MGGTVWSDASYTDRSRARAASATPAFSYDSSVKSGKVATAAHVTLDPKKMAFGPRECRDSTAHPKSKPILINLDVTGSMGEVPRMMQLKLKELMAYLLRKGYIEDPAICISANGDAEAGDRVPFQLGQFESGIELENDLTNLYIEGNGGGNRYENYDIPLYTLARLVKSDAFEKRGEKGYAFIICDEALPAVCKASTIKSVFGINEERNIPIAELVKEVQEKWELFCIVPKMTHHYKTSMQKNWEELLGQNVIYLEDPNAIVETIAGAIGVLEDNVDLDGLGKDIADVSKGLSRNSISAVKNALSVVKPSKGRGLKKLTTGTGLATL